MRDIESGFYALGIVVLMLTSGCASTVRINATASSVAAVTLGAAQRLVLSKVDAEIAACAGDVPCLDAAEARVAPWATGLDAFRGVILVHREATEIGALGEESDLLRESLARAWSLVTAEYDAAIRWLRGLGVDVGVLGALPEVL